MQREQHPHSVQRDPSTQVGRQKRELADDVEPSGASARVTRSPDGVSYQQWTANAARVLIGPHGCPNRTWHTSCRSSGMVKTELKCGVRRDPANRQDQQPSSTRSHDGRTSAADSGVNGAIAASLRRCLSLRSRHADLTVPQPARALKRWFRSPTGIDSYLLGLGHLSGHGTQESTES